MVLLDEVKRRLSELQPEVADLADALAIERSKLRLEELENKSADPAFYDDAANSGKVFAEMGEIKEKLESYRQLQELCSDAETLLEMCAEDGTDEAMAEEAQQTVDTLAEKVEEMRLVTLLTGEYDANNAILTFHAGAGGTEAQDWAEMLLRMYTRFGARHGWNVKTLDYSGRRRGRPEKRLHSGGGAQRLRLFEKRKRRAPAGARFAVRCVGPPPHQFCLAGSDAGDGRQNHGGNSPRGHQDGSVPLVRRGRPAHQQNVLGRAPHPHSHGHCGKPARTSAASFRTATCA